MINIVIADPFISQVEADTLETAALAVLQHQNTPSDSNLSIVIDDDAALHQLNHDFLDIDAPTDVLSFPAGEDEVDPETGQAYLGDVIISYPRAAEQAASAGHPIPNELQLLVVHGILHLLGHDHATPEEKSIMWTAQSEILSRLNVHISRLPE
jgi:probable rRNA maturation factor